VLLEPVPLELVPVELVRLELEPFGCPLSATSRPLLVLRREPTVVNASEGGHLLSKGGRTGAARSKTGTIIFLPR
jgi:hypothetical protein